MSDKITHDINKNALYNPSAVWKKKWLFLPKNSHCTLTKKGLKKKKHSGGDELLSSVWVLPLEWSSSKQKRREWKKKVKIQRQISRAWLLDLSAEEKKLKEWSSCYPPAAFSLGGGIILL